VNRSDLIIRHNGPNYVVHFPNGDTSTWPDDISDGALWENAFNGHACEALLKYRDRTNSHPSA